VDPVTERLSRASPHDASRRLAASRGPRGRVATQEALSRMPIARHPFAGHARCHSQTGAAHGAHHSHRARPRAARSLHPTKATRRDGRRVGALPGTCHPRRTREARGATRDHAPPPHGRQPIRSRRLKRITRGRASGSTSRNRTAELRQTAQPQGLGGAASILARLRRRRAASACFLRRFTEGFM
jgi:hypothetical protein